MFRHITTRVSGLIILIAGIWGALIPFVGPYFHHFVLGPDQHWKWTTGRLWLNVLPGVVAALGGLILMGGGPRVSGRFGALMALAAGIWFIVGPDVSTLWNHGHSVAGAPVGTNTFKRFLELLTFHSGLGALITTFAAYSIPGVTYVTRGRAGRDAELAGAGAAAGAAAEHHHDRRVAEREGAAAPAGEPVAQREGGHGAGTVAGAGVAGAAAGAAAEHHHDRHVAERETGAEAEPVTRQQAGPGNGAGGAGATAPNGAAEEGGAPAGTRRRGGLAGLFSRR